MTSSVDVAERQLVVAKAKLALDTVKAKFADELPDCSTITAVLELLLKRAEDLGLGFSQVRYWRLRTIDGEERLSPVDLAGPPHSDQPVTPEIRRQFSLWQSIRRDKDEEDKSSFFVFDLRRKGRPDPCVCMIDPQAAKDSFMYDQLLTDETKIRFFRVKSDGLTDILGADKDRPAWVDIGLRVAGHDVGKLCCSLSCGRDGFDKKVGDDARAMSELAKYAAPYLNSFRHHDLNYALESAGQQVFAQKTYSDLYNFCTEKLRTIDPLNYESADILILIRDHLKSKGNKEHPISPHSADCAELLVLRGTTDKNGRDKLHIKRYPMSAEERERRRFPEGVLSYTEWVWYHKKPIRITQMEKVDERRTQEKEYDRDGLLQWAHYDPPEGAKPVQNTLIVPIRYQSDEDDAEILGVLRFTNRDVDKGAEEVTAIDDREEFFAQRLADRFIAPKIKSLQKEEFTGRLLENDHLSKLNLFRAEIETTGRSGNLFEGNGQKDRSLKDQFEDAVKVLFSREEWPAGKLALVNFPDEDRTEIRHEIIVGDLKLQAGLQIGHPYAGSLTKYVIDHLTALERVRKDYEAERSKLEAKPEMDRTGSESNRIKKLKELEGEHAKRFRPYLFLNDLPYAKSQGCYQPVTLDVEAVTKCALATGIKVHERYVGALVLLSDRFDIHPYRVGNLLHFVATQLGYIKEYRSVIDHHVCIGGLAHDAQSLIRNLGDLIEDLAGSERAPSALEVMNFNTLLTSWSSAIEMYCLGGPPMIDGRIDATPHCDTAIEVRRYVEQAARVAVLAVQEKWPPERLDDRVKIVEADTIHARVWPACLRVTVMNLVKNALAHGVDHHPVEIRIERRPATLIIQVSNRPLHSGQIAELKARLDRNLPFDLKPLRTDRSGRGRGLLLVDCLMNWYRLPDPVAAEGERRGWFRKGRLDDDQVCFVLEMPIADESAQRRPLNREMANE